MAPINTPLSRLKAARSRMEAVHKHGLVDPYANVDEADLVPVDAEEYLLLIKDMVSYQDRAYEIRAWAKAFANRKRADIEGRDITKVLQEWKVSGGASGGPLSNASLNRRRTALMSLWTKQTRRYTDEATASRVLSAVTAIRQELAVGKRTG